MNTKALRQKVLDLAIHGKLVPQNPTDESAEKLLERIRLEKAERIKKGELKVDKKDSYIFVGTDKRHYEKFADGTIKDIEDEIPFEVPEGWAWCRLGELSKKIKRGKSPKYIEKSSIMSFAQKCNQKDNSTSLEKALYIDESTLKKYTDDEKMQINDVVINSTGTGTLGRVGIFNCKIPEDVIAVYPDSHVTTVRFCSELNKLYCYYFVKNKQSYLETKGEGSTNQKELKTDSISNLLFPLPPIAEQNRIVEKIEELLSVIESIEENKIDLGSLIIQAKSKILDLAIHGKLVPQDPTDEPASILLEKIRAEKEEKISKGELKREKKDSYIYKGSDNFYHEKFADGTIKDIEDEIPFDVPEGWVWCRIKYLALDMADGPFGSNLKTEHYTAKKEVRLIQLSNIGEYGWREENTKYTTFEHAKNNIARSIVEPGNIVIAKMMPAGRAIICPNIEKMYVLSSDAIKLVPTSFINIQFLLNVINSPSFRNSVTDNVQGSTRLRTSISKLKECLFPLPPLDEQNRIVEKIEELIATLDNIQENII